MELIITPEVKKLGINACMALVREVNISNKSNPLEKRKKEVVEKVQGADIATDPILQAYHELYQVAEVEGEGFVPPAEHLLGLIKRNGRLPNINTVVDSYNLVSAETSLSIGAHDLAHLKGNVSFRITDGSEKYTPLGENEPVKVFAGEYACMDDEKIICRMDVKQCNETKITKETKAFIVYVQGNRNTEFAYLLNALQKVCDLITEICGGTYQIILEQT